MKLESYWLFKVIVLMFRYILVVFTGYIQLLISICPMLKAGKLHSIASSDILSNYFKGAKIPVWWLFAQLYKNSVDCFVLDVSTVGTVRRF